MARQNNVFLYGIIEKKPRIVLDKETHEPVSAIGYIHVVRGVREAHDGKKYMKHDHPLIVSLEPIVIKHMAEWEENDVVYIKGTIASKKMDKKSYCPNCVDDNGHPTENVAKGLLTYINPIFVKVMKKFPDKESALADVIKAREISNQVIVVGNLFAEPSYFKTKNGLIVSQYQIITNRKFRIRTDDPDVKTDWPWVKSYGEQAIEDRMRLKSGSCVIIDGFIQARKVNRKTKCKCCGKIYPWQDSTMELVPFETEYVQGTYKTDEDLQEEQGQKAEDIRNSLFNHLIKDELTEDMNTDDIDTGESDEK